MSKGLITSCVSNIYEVEDLEAKKNIKCMPRGKFKIDEIACIGDQLFTDILGANRMGFTSILVNRVAKNEILPTRINRFFEKIVLKRLAKKNILKSGEYYD